MRWAVVPLAWEDLRGTPWEHRLSHIVDAVVNDLGLDPALGPGAGTGVSPDVGAVVLDARCPGTPVAHVRACVDAAAAGTVVVSVRPVTDTVSRLDGGVDGGLVGEGEDRDGLMAVCSPVVVPPGRVALLGDRLEDLLAGREDLPALVARLVAEGVSVVTVEAPVEGRRLADPDELVLLSPA